MAASVFFLPNIVLLWCGHSRHRVMLRKMEDDEVHKAP